MVENRNQHVRRTFPLGFPLLGFHGFLGVLNPLPGLPNPQRECSQTRELQGASPLGASPNSFLSDANPQLCNFGNLPWKKPHSITFRLQRPLNIPWPKDDARHVARPPRTENLKQLPKKEVSDDAKKRDAWQTGEQQQKLALYLATGPTTLINNTPMAPELRSWR